MFCCYCLGAVCSNNFDGKTLQGKKGVMTGYRLPLLWWLICKHGSSTLIPLFDHVRLQIFRETRAKPAHTQLKEHIDQSLTDFEVGKCYLSQD